MNNSYKRVLIVAAHPDDEVLGCGGTIARLVREGSNVSCLLLGEGPKSRYALGTDAFAQDVRGVEEFARRASSVLGISTLRRESFPDNRFDAAPLLDIVKAVERVIREIHPEVIFTHSRADLNIDHRKTFEAVLTACRPLPGASVRALYSWENPSSTEWNHPSTFQPNTFFDISKTLEKKIEAFGCYETEVKPFPHPRSPDALRATAVRWGSLAGVRAAEPFELIRRVL